MKLEAVVICIQYSDFLNITLLHNKHFFNKMVVVTDTKDSETARVCEFHNVMCVKTDAFYEDPEIRKNPNKAKGINEGLRHLDRDGWVCQLDADIVLPALFRSIMEKYPLDDKCIYGTDRLMCNSYKDWIKYFYTGKPIHEGWVYLHTNHFQIGTRIVKYLDEGYIPIGFLQIFHPKGSNVYSYPVMNATFDRTDVIFAQKFPKEKRRFIADFLCIHLASEKAKQGQNWNGRKTKPFRPMTFKEKVYHAFYKYKFQVQNALKKSVPDRKTYIP